ncbi:MULTISPECIES: histidine utilization repressor [unclassified Chelatococcus]|uniref:histidine utilization repressor n=1 Tax=unclassified Chelatococcus TaxID=2638111 RepID=UPI001BCBF9E8|nr:MULTISPECIES: histidine utilization repressor [unclassified Chelatococcus]MBS7700303.1 histidine utilization repressor [Chelatococcus sp. YT9]MBX3558274.1 histidine utilization repressor [Chelatococcus sp.]
MSGIGSQNDIADDGDDEALPIYQQIRHDIERKIMSGDWREGYRVPSESELATMYDCSRMTANKAISSLSSAGLIVRRRGSGSYVAPPRSQEPLLAMQDIRSEILSIDRAYSCTVLNRTISSIGDPVEAVQVGAPVGTKILLLDMVHYADSLPYALETRRINLMAVPEAEREGFEMSSPGSWLVNNATWTKGEHSVRAISADNAIAKQLRVPRGTACISIARRTWRAGDLITFARFIYPGDRHRFVVQFTPTSSGSPA